MVFSSVSFLIIFLPLVLLIYWIAPKKIKNFVLLIFSLSFYFCGEQKLVLIMVLSCIVNYVMARIIEASGKKSVRRALLVLDILYNLGMLCYFKYLDFFIESFNYFFQAKLPVLNVVLPIGISFYTFQTLSYVVDVYNGKYKAEKNLIDFSLYVTFFPQLIAGPIVRYEDVIKEIKNRKITSEMFSYGITRFCIGLAKKVLISNSIAEIVKIYSSSSTHTLAIAWLTAIAIPLQIYFDFSGYSDMAIGLGKMFGFNFPENFNYPLFANSATDFWRKWHITLGTWFRDYVYIPLGGNRVKKSRHIFNILIVWALTGLWHGASWNFVIWGLYYGVILLLEKYIYGSFLEKHTILSKFYTVLVTIVGFEIFNAESLQQISKYLLELVGVGVTNITTNISNYYIRSYSVIMLIAIICATPLLKNIIKKVEDKRFFKVVENICCIMLLILSIAYLVDGSYNPFLYFRF